MRSGDWTRAAPFGHERRRGGALRRLQARAVVRRGVVYGRPLGHDAAGVHRLMASVVVVLDVMQVHCVGDTGHLVELAGVAPQVGVVDETLPVALEVAVGDRLEAYMSGEQGTGGFGHPVAQQVA